MPQCRLGIYLVLRHLLGEKKKVVLTPYTLYDVVNMVICAGGQPVFADIERATCNSDPADIDRTIDDQTGAVLMTHLHGLACPVEEIVAICMRKNVPLIEDVAQGLGAKVNGRALGSFGAASFYSFGVWKNVNSFYGGMIATDDRDLYDTTRQQIRHFPFFETSLVLKRLLHCLFGEIATCPPVFSISTFPLVRYGYLHKVRAINGLWGNFAPVFRDKIPESYFRQMTPMQARLVNHQLDLIDEHCRKRVQRARLYHQGLSDIQEVLLPPMREDGSHIYLTFPIQVPDRRNLVSYLMKNRRDVTEQHFANNADNPLFASFRRNCPNARLTADQVVLLPTYPQYAESQVRENVGWIRRFFGRTDE